MSWCRFNSVCELGCKDCPGSDVYIFKNTDGLYECCSCWLLGPFPSGSFTCKTKKEMYRHILEHDTAGHHVPRPLVANAKGVVA